MNIWYDVFSILVIFSGMMFGFNMGLVRQVVSVAGLYFGLVFASYFQPQVTRLAAMMLGEASSLTRDAILFFLVFTLVWMLINVGGHFSFRQAPRFMTPALDRVLGAILGSLTGVLAIVIITLLLSYATQVTWPQNNGLRSFLQGSIQASFLRPLFLSIIPTVANSLEPWLPRGLPAFFSHIQR